MWWRRRSQSIHARPYAGPRGLGCHARPNRDDRHATVDRTSGKLQTWMWMWRDADRRAASGTEFLQAWPSRQSRNYVPPPGISDFAPVSRPPSLCRATVKRKLPFLHFGPFSVRGGLVGPKRLGKLELKLECLSPAYARTGVKRNPGEGGKKSG
ncbi:hypothetical protein L1887_50620 [Cichorium endivia]|nr:hypothetical protein L1887_50620 [Cichorium endivia]